MMIKRFEDTLICDGALRKTDEGYAVQARVARAGNVQDYLARELRQTVGGDSETIRVYRPADEVFAKDAIATYARKPITIGHPAELVTEDTWKHMAVGEIDRDVMRDGEFVSVPLLFRDAKAIDLVRGSDGPRELSMGYTAGIRWEDGVTPDGERYDAIMTNFRMNHVAVVPQARGGKELRIGDNAGKWGATPFTMSDQKETLMSDALKTVVLGDKAVQVSATDVATIEAFKADAAKKLADAETAHTAAIAAKDAEIAKVEAAKDAAEAKVLSDADLDKKVSDRAALVATAKAIASDVKTDGLSDAEIKKAVVVAKLGDKMTDKSEAYVDVRFDILAEDVAKADPFADAVKIATPSVSDINSAYDARDKRLREAHKAKKEA